MGDDAAGPPGLSRGARDRHCWGKRHAVFVHAPTWRFNGRMAAISSTAGSPGAGRADLKAAGPSPSVPAHCAVDLRHLIDGVDHAPECWRTPRPFRQFMQTTRSSACRGCGTSGYGPLRAGLRAVLLAPWERDYQAITRNGVRPGFWCESRTRGAPDTRLHLIGFFRLATRPYNVEVSLKVAPLPAKTVQEAVDWLGRTAASRRKPLGFRGLAVWPPPCGARTESGCRLTKPRRCWRPYAARRQVADRRPRLWRTLMGGV